MAEPQKPPVAVGSQAAGPTFDPREKHSEEEMKPQRHSSEEPPARKRETKSSRKKTSSSRRTPATARTKKKVEDVPRDELTVDDLDSCEDDDAALLDLPRLHAEAKVRRQRMEERMPITGRTMDNIDKTFSANVIKLIAGNQQALANAIRALAVERSELLDDLSASEAYKRKALCKQVVKGDFDL